MLQDKLSEETRRLNDRITLITNEVTKNLMETQQKMKDDMMNKYNTLEAVSLKILNKEEG